MMNALKTIFLANVVSATGRNESVKTNFNDKMAVPDIIKLYENQLNNILDKIQPNHSIISIQRNIDN